MALMLRNSAIWSAAIAAVMSAGVYLRADNVREYDQNGLRYRETTQIVQRPVYETTWKEQTREVQRPTFTTEQQPTTRTVYVPITEYKTQPVMRGRWNPFVEPYYEYRLVPVTRWEVKQETVNVPIVRQSTTPEKQTVKVPVTTLRYENEEFIRREIVGRALGDPAGGSSAANTAARDTHSTGSYGSKSLSGDPPRGGSGRY
ncbi:MAG: hypothetical protein WD875_17450 [Pirellulales bacterium]